MDRLQHIKNRVNKALANIAGSVKDVWAVRYADDAAWLLEDRENTRRVLCELADRVYWWTVDGTAQEADRAVLARAREYGWLPWHEYEPGKTQYEESLRKVQEREGR